MTEPVPMKSPASTAKLTSTANLLAETEPRVETWAVEVLETAGKRGNQDILAAVWADSLAEPEKEFQIRLVNVATSIPCGLGGSLPVSRVDTKRVKAHEVQVFKDHVSPLLSTSAGKKLKPKYIPVRNDNRDEGLRRVAHKLKAQRLYIHVSRNSKQVESLALVMPGGCTVVGVSKGKKVSEATAATVDVFDSNQPQEDSFSNSVGCCSEVGSRRMSRTTSVNGTGPTIEYFEYQDIPRSPVPGQSFSVNLGVPAVASLPLSPANQQAQGSVSAQFLLARAGSIGEEEQATHFSGPMLLMCESSPSSPSPRFGRGSTWGKDVVNHAHSSPFNLNTLSPLGRSFGSHLDSASVLSSPLSQASESSTPRRGDREGRRERMAKRANSAKERGGGLRILSRMMMSFGSTKER